MSPKNLQKALKNQQKAIRADLEKQKLLRNKNLLVDQRPERSNKQVLNTAATQPDTLNKSNES